VESCCEAVLGLAIHFMTGNGPKAPLDQTDVSRYDVPNGADRHQQAQIWESDLVKVHVLEIQTL
jgi:hypothetical protein